MSRVSELLNPAPNAESTTTSPTTITSGAHHGYHNRHPSLTSPLEALAIAATGSPPVLSPTHPAGTPSISTDGHHRSFSSSSSRPGSSHFSLPAPLNLTQPQQSFSPTLEHYTTNHHPNNNRRISDIADGNSRELPPLRRSITDNMDISPVMLSATRSSFDEQSYLNGDQPTQYMPAMFEMKSETRLSEETPATPSIAQVLQPLAKPATDDGNKTRETAILSGEKSSLKPVNDSQQSPNENSLAQSENFPSLDGIDEQATRQGGIEDLNPNPNIALKREDSTQGYSSIANAPTETQPASTISDSQDKNKKATSKPEKKKGTATIKKPTTKKRKLEPESKDGTPFSQRSGTPASSYAGKTPASRQRKQNSATPMHSSPAPNARDTDDDDDDDSELFCICHKPDDHTWMIACDGGCEDWFHGRCVDMNERDGNLIDKYICPNCREKGIGQTSWKPMCRLESCREPARVVGSKPSKYCCDEHGEEYMATHALGQDAKRDDSSRAGGASRKRRRDNYTDNIGNAEEDPAMQAFDNEDDEQAYLRGGVLSAADLKTLTGTVKNLEEFRKLGDGVLSPPTTISLEQKNVKIEEGDEVERMEAKITYTPEEESQLTEIASNKASLKRKRESLDDRERFLALVRTRAKIVLDELKKKENIKDICGYDIRLSWSEEEFNVWRASSEGRKAFESGALGPVTSPVHLTDGFTKAVGDVDEKMVNGDDSTVDEIGKGVCQKKRCERHKQWYKLQQQDIAFEKQEGRQEMRRFDTEEKGVRERATLRTLQNGEGGPGEGVPTEAGGETVTHDGS